LTSSDPSLSPSLAWIRFSHSSYYENGTIETEDLEVNDLIDWVNLNSTFGLTTAPGSSVTFMVSADSGDTWEPVPPDGNLSGLPTGDLTIRFKAAFETGNTSQTPWLDTFSLAYRLNALPTLEKAFEPVSFPEDTALIGAYNLSEHFTDDGPLTFGVVSNTTNVSVTLHTNGTVDLNTTNENWFGKAMLTFSAQDEFGVRTDAQVEVTVTPVNDLPEITSIPQTSTLVGEAYTYQMIVTDVDDDTIEYSLGQYPENLTIDSCGKIEWVPNETHLGRNQVEVSVSDGTAVIWQNFTITVNRVSGNNPPVITGLPVAFAYVETPYRDRITAHDADNDTLTYAFDEAPHGMVIAPATGEIEWTPDESDLGNVTVIFNVSDRFVSVLKELTIQVLPKGANTPPDIKDIAGIKVKGKPVTIDLSTYVEDDQDPASDLIWRIESSSTDLFTAEIIGNQLRITPIEGEKGDGSITLVVRDTGGLESKTTVPVKVEKKDEETNLGELLMTDYLVCWLLPLVIVMIIIAFIVATRKRPGPEPARPELPEAEEVSRSDLAEQEVEKALKKVVKEAEDVSKVIDDMTGHLVAVVQSLVDEGIIEGGESLTKALEWATERAKVMDSAGLSEDGRIILVLEDGLGVEEGALGLGTFLDVLLLHELDEAGLTKLRDQIIDTAKGAMKDREGPGAALLKSCILHGTLSNNLLTGIPGLDDLLGGGLPKGETVLFQMPSGGTKSVMTIQLAQAGFRTGQGVLVSLSERSPTQFYQEAEQIGVDAETYAEVGKLVIVDWNAHKTKRVKDIEEDGSIIRASKSLTNLAIAIGDGAKRLEDEPVLRATLDIISPAIKIFDLDAGYSFLQNTVARLKENGITAVFFVDKDMHEPEELGTIGQCFDNIVDITTRRDEKRIVTEIAVLTMSRPGYSSDIREVVMTERGLVIEYE
jgi:KaiC/GvpD/RAD55 family RecA-like ATPase